MRLCKPLAWLMIIQLIALDMLKLKIGNKDMLYHVTKQYGRSPEIKCNSFKTLAEAKQFVDENIQGEVAMKIEVIYRIKEFDDVIEAFDSTKISLHDEPANESSTSTGKNSEAVFRPSPLQSALKPAGMQQNWVKPKDDDKK
jgi:hypothetical protein